MLIESRWRQMLKTIQTRYEGFLTESPEARPATDLVSEALAKSPKLCHVSYKLRVLGTTGSA
jgi:hypothetical protein